MIEENHLNIFDREIDSFRRRPGLIQWFNYAMMDMLPKWSVRRDPSLKSCKKFETKHFILRKKHFIL